MSLGKPVIATKPGGPEEIIEDKKNGILVPFGEADAMGDAILSYLSQPEFAAKIGSAARQRALSSIGVSPNDGRPNNAGFW